MKIDPGKFSNIKIIQLCPVVGHWAALYERGGTEKWVTMNVDGTTTEESKKVTFMDHVPLVFWALVQCRAKSMPEKETRNEMQGVIASGKDGLMFAESLEGFIEYGQVNEVMKWD